MLGTDDVGMYRDSELVSRCLERLKGQTGGTDGGRGVVVYAGCTGQYIVSKSVNPVTH